MKKFAIILVLSILISSFSVAFAANEETAASNQMAIEETGEQSNNKQNGK